jgi:hypothetical protein
MPEELMPAVTSSARTAMCTARPVPIGTVESEMTMASLGHTAMFWECPAPGFDTQNSRHEAGAYQTATRDGGKTASATYGRAS